MSVVSVEVIKKRLNKTSSTDTAELQDLLDGAEAEYLECVGPLAAETVTDELTAVRPYLSRVPVLSVTSAANAGAAVALPTLDVNLRTGKVMSLRAGRRYPLSVVSGSFTVTYQAGYPEVDGVVQIPANIREVIAADVAGLFIATQRGGGEIRPGFPGEGFAEPVRTQPMVLYPRIRALAASGIA